MYCSRCDISLPPSSFDQDSPIQPSAPIRAYCLRNSGPPPSLSSSSFISWISSGVMTVFMYSRTSCCSAFSSGVSSMFMLCPQTCIAFIVKVFVSACLYRRHKLRLQLLAAGIHRTHPGIYQPGIARAQQFRNRRDIFRHHGESVQDIIGDQRTHLLPAILSREAIGLGLQLAPAVQLQYRPVGRCGGVETDLALHRLLAAREGLLVGTRDHEHRRADVEASALAARALQTALHGRQRYLAQVF